MSTDDIATAAYAFQIAAQSLKDANGDLARLNRETRAARNRVLDSEKCEKVAFEALLKAAGRPVPK